MKESRSPILKNSKKGISNGVKDDFNKAKDYCFKLFKYRLRSEKEIRDRLKKRRFSSQIIENLIVYLKSLNYINDSLFTKSWIEARIKKPFGLERIIYELKDKGISEEIIQEEIQKIRKDYSESDRAKRLAQEKFKSQPRIDPEKLKRRVYSFLLRRGFSPEVIYEVLDEY